MVMSLPKILLGIGCNVFVCLEKGEKCGPRLSLNNIRSCS